MGINNRVAMKFIHKNTPEGYITGINRRVAMKFIHKNTTEGYITGINSRVAMKFIHKNGMGMNGNSIKELKINKMS